MRRYLVQLGFICENVTKKLVKKFSTFLFPFLAYDFMFINIKERENSIFLC